MNSLPLHLLENHKLFSHKKTPDFPAMILHPLRASPPERPARAGAAQELTPDAALLGNRLVVLFGWESKKRPQDVAAERQRLLDRLHRRKLGKAAHEAVDENFPDPRSSRKEFTPAVQSAVCASLASSSAFGAPILVAKLNFPEFGCRHG